MAQTRKNRHIDMPHRVSSGIFGASNSAGFQCDHPKTDGDPGVGNVQKFSSFRQVTDQWPYVYFAIYQINFRSLRAWNPFDGNVLATRRFVENFNGGAGG